MFWSTAVKLLEQKQCYVGLMQMITFQDLHLLLYIQPLIILAIYLNETICKILGCRLFPSSDMLLVYWIWKRIACVVTLPYTTL